MLKQDTASPGMVVTETLIVGAGIAGLYAAYLLRKSNVSTLVLEAGDHAGGRVFSRPEISSELGLTIDEGANLINSLDALAIRLMNNFGIKYVRRISQNSDSMHYFIGGRLFTQAEMNELLFAESPPTAIDAFRMDQRSWFQAQDRDTNTQFIDESIASYLLRIGAGPVLVRMVSSFFWSEYGHSLEELNVFVLFDYFEIDADRPHFRLIPNADEAYTVPGGTGQITCRLAEETRDVISFGQRVVGISEKNGLIEVAHVGPDGRTATRLTKHVFFAAPLPSLKHIGVYVAGVSQQSLEQARAATYANNTKLHLKFANGFHSCYKFNGILLTEAGEQIWPSSIGQGGAGLLTVLTGPLPDGPTGADDSIERILGELDALHPGLRGLYVGMERSDAPMSYSGALRPGEASNIAFNDGGLHWTTIGEASSKELQGYLEGALRSAEQGVSDYLISRRWSKGSRRRLLSRTRAVTEETGFTWQGIPI